jgi:hypothetical protein
MGRRDQSVGGVLPRNSHAMPTLTSCLYCAARLSADGRAIKHRRVMHRVRNIAIGRLLAHAGIWRRDVPEQHRARVAAQTAAMPEPMREVMGDTAPELDAQRSEIAKIAKSNKPRKSRALAVVTPDDGVREVLPPNDAEDAVVADVLAQFDPSTAEDEEVGQAVVDALSVDAPAPPTNATRDELRRLFSAGGVSKVDCAKQVYGADATRSQIKTARRALAQDASGQFIVPPFLQRRAEKMIAARAEKRAEKAAQ